MYSFISYLLHLNLTSYFLPLTSKSPPQGWALKGIVSVLILAAEIKERL